MTAWPIALTINTNNSIMLVGNSPPPLAGSVNGTPFTGSMTYTTPFGDPVVPLTSYQAGTDLATIADMSDLIFKGTVDEIDVGKLHAGTPAHIKIGALPEALVTGRMSRIAPQATEKDGARLFEVEIELDRAPGIVLRAGYSANADLIIREKKDVLTIPERLIQFDGDGKRAYVEIPGKKRGDKPTRVEVQTGLSDGLNVEILSGLSEKDKVVQRPPKEIAG